MKANILALVTAILFTPFVVKGAPTNAGNFQIADNGVHGEGTYQTKGDTAEIKLRLVIGAVSASEVNKTVDQGQLRPVKGNTPAYHVFNDAESQFMQEVLQEHNVYRAIHGASPLKLSTQMSMEAFAFAQELAKNGTLKHSFVFSRPNQGESLAMGCSTDGPGITAKGVVKKWYDEVCKHNFANHDFQKPSGHFINLVWKPTEEIGVAEVRGTKWGMNCTWVVARYKPRVQFRPEVENSFGLNVDKGSFDPAYCNSITEENQKTGNKALSDQGTLDKLYGNKALSDQETLDKPYGYRMSIPRISRVMVA